jgi:uncharacterized protein (DUF1501 family)
MRRRNFLKHLNVAAGASFALNQIPIKIMDAYSPFMRLASQSSNDKVLVILQMHGGNDGLNTFIPVEQYDLYYSRRANIAIPAKNSVRSMIHLDSTLPSDVQVGLHPDLLGMKDMYDRGRMAVVQGVSYPNNNGSHFRGRDIWFMGGGPEDYYSSGWVGRYLQKSIEPMMYPDEFPNAQHPDPLAIEMGSDVSLIFHQKNNIPLSISLGSDPESLANLVGELEGFTDEGFDPRGKPPAFLDNSHYGKELNWILGLEDKSEDYAARLYEIYSRSSPARVTYPEVYPFNAPKSSLRNRLAPQLQMIARLLDGGGAGQGVNTKVFLVKVGGFDTHATQVESYDPTMGSHAALLYHISSAMRAFQEDLRERGIEDRVLTLTTSEFGRRIGSNGSYGTDHGKGGPMMIFGSGVNPGVYGTNPDMTKKNVDMQFDYRQVYANILKDWMGVNEEVIQNDIFFGDFIRGPKPDGGFFEPLPLASQQVTSNEAFLSERYWLGKAYPNPANEQTKIRYRINSPGDVSLTLYDIQGKPVRKLVSEFKDPGEHEVSVRLDGLTAGIYIYEIQAGILKDSKRLIVRK